MRQVRGIPASSGLASGRVCFLRTATPVDLRPPGSLEEEATRLVDAIDLASRELGHLAERLADSEAGIIEFQLELLQDESVTATVRRAIESGQSALQAWQMVIAEEIQAYRLGTNTYLSARADDLHDLAERVVRHLVKDQHKVEEAARCGECLLLADVLLPSRFLELDLAGLSGIATAAGSPTSHVSLLAKARGIPMIVGCGDGLAKVADGEEAFLDAEVGILCYAVDPVEKQALLAKIDARAVRDSLIEGSEEPVATVTGERVQILANLEEHAVAGRPDMRDFDGVGLFRTEFLFAGGVFPSEDEQYRIYRSLLEWAGDRPVTVRLLDAGGDKPIAGMTAADEQNPFLGLRGFRLFALHQDVFCRQMRALSRAATIGRLKVMVPMIAVPEEMQAFRAEMMSIVENLTQAGIPCRLPELGMMVEVPSAALMPGDFETDFYSIGTNDLIQYTLAVARDEHRLAHLARGDNAAVLGLIKQVADAGRSRNRDVSVCGDMASDPQMVPHLLRAGIRSLSITPAAVAAVKHSIRHWSGN
jgi:phosphotransferase system enzyme I (PtsI)